MEVVRETDRVAISLDGWGGTDKRVDFPVQFLPDVQAALKKISEVLE